MLAEVKRKKLMITPVPFNYQTRNPQQKPSFCAKLIITEGGKKGIKRIFLNVKSRKMAENIGVIGHYWNPMRKQLNFVKMYKELKKGVLKKLYRFQGSIVLDKSFDRYHPTNHNIFHLKCLDRNGKVILEDASFNLLPALAPNNTTRITAEPILKRLKSMCEQAN